jgi:AmmeMemoRadiSam system protein A
MGLAMIAAAPSLLGKQEAHLLLRVAREAIGAKLLDRAPPPLPTSPPRILERQGAFVSLHHEGELRGCIGLITPQETLVETIAYCAVAAAFDDPRFPPLTPSEFPSLTMEISVLSPPTRTDDVEHLVVGRHGLIVTLGKRRGLLLPQVATQRGWDAVTFLQETCRKAGLPKDAWEHGAIVEAFEAQVFSEDSLPDQ